MPVRKGNNMNNLKGYALEYIVRRLLVSCGFTNVPESPPYTFESGDNFYLNGRGAAHDADVLMTPPFQIPFGYPSRLLFECKAKNRNVGLPLVRNAYGLKVDINEFEIVTTDSLNKRKVNKRAPVAIENRDRFIYQVGLAAVNPFTTQAIEFAANNKIPLLSLSWFFSRAS